MQAHNELQQAQNVADRVQKNFINIYTYECYTSIILVLVLVLYVIK